MYGLTNTERALFNTLYKNADRMVSPETLLCAGWPTCPDPDALWLKPHMARIRAKVSGFGFTIKAGYGGKGYRMVW